MEFRIADTFTHSLAREREMMRGRGTMLHTRLCLAVFFIPRAAQGAFGNGSGILHPYLLAWRCGKGMIILGGDDVRLSPARMLENFMAHRDRQMRRDHQPTGDHS